MASATGGVGSKTMALGSAPAPGEMVRYCEACEDLLVPRPHTAPGHVEPAWMCNNSDCLLSGVCLTCRLMTVWFHAQNEALGDGG